MDSLDEYIGVGWENEPSRRTPVNAYNLGIMEDGIKRLFAYLIAGGGIGPGTNGREIELRNSGEYIQWRYSGEEDWVNLVSLADLKGEKGDDYVLTDEDIEEIASKVKVETSADKITYDDTETQLGADNVQDAISKVSEQKVDNPSTGTVGQILEIETVDENGKPKTYKAVDKPTGGGSVEIKESAEVFSTQPIGQLFERPVPYSAWCSQSLQYDSNLGKYVDLIHGTTSHMASTSNRTLWVTYINPVTFEAEEPIECKYVDASGNELTPSNKGQSAWLILDDGRYLLFNHINGTMYRFISTDYGETWVQEQACSGYPSTMDMYFLIKLSNGRLLANSAEMKSIARSDDMGLTWKYSTPTTVGGDLEAEIFMSEVKEGVIVAIGRYSMQGIGYYASGDSEHAIISFSYDYGETWTPWKISDTLDNMNASSCTGYCHDGILEIFTGSRWYYSDSHSNTDYDNTGKTGAITHYVATIDNALNDNFTKLGVVVYAKAIGTGSSQDFHTPCIAVNGKEMLMCYFDRVEPYSEESANHYFIRGHMGSSIDYGVRDDLISAVFPYSSSMVDKLLKKQYAELMTKINEIIISGGGTPDTGDPENPYSYILDGIIFNFNMIDSSKYDAENLTIKDSINDLEAKLVTSGFSRENLTVLPTIRDNSSSSASIYLQANTLGQYLTDEDFELSLEWSWYQYGDDTTPTTSDMLYQYEWERVQIYGDRTVPYINSEGTKVNSTATWRVQNIFINYTKKDAFQHGVLTFSKDGTFRHYLNGELTGEFSVGDDFASWDTRYKTGDFRMGGYCKSLRMYKKALSSDEVLNNYNYEKASIVY